MDRAPVVSYQSAAKRPAWLARLWPNLYFYPRMISIIWLASRVARRGDYDDAAWRRSCREILGAMESAGVRVSVENTEVIERLPGPAVYIGNHMSTAETFILAGFFLPAKRMTFVVKRSLVEYPVFGHIMRSRDPVVVERKNAKDDLKTVLEEGAERLARGYSVVVFPQHTRTVQFDPADFNSIGVKLAKRAGVPVVPLAIRTDAWGNGKLLKDFGRLDPGKPVHIAFGEPMTLQGNGKEENEAIIAFIQERLKAWGL